MQPGKELEAWRVRSRLTVEAACRRLGFNRAFWYELVKGQKLPSVTTAARIQGETGIPAARWGE